MVPRTQPRHESRKRAPSRPTAEKLLPAIFDSCQDAIVSRDEAGLITTWNAGAEKLFGYTPEEIIGKPIEILIPEDRRNDEEIIMNRLREGGLIGYYPARRCRKDGSTVEVSISASAIRNRDGRIIGAAKIMRDLTPSLQAQAELDRSTRALNESEIRYRILFDSIDEGFCVLEVLFDQANRPCDYRILEVNPAFERQTGLRDATGKGIRELIPNHEQYWFDIYGRVATTGRPVRFENRSRGLQRWYDVYAFRIGSIRERKVAVLFNDITKRKETEETLRDAQVKLQLAIEGSDIGIWDWNIITGERVWSDRSKEMFGIPLASTVTRELFLERVHPDDRASVTTALAAALEQGNDYSQEYRVIHPDGQQRWVLTKGRVFYDDQGTATRMSGTVIDITASKRTQEESKEHLERLIAERTARLQETVSELESFSYTVSHDLRSPLRAMQAFAYMTAEEYGACLDETGRGYLKRIDAAARRMDTLIQDVIAYSRAAPASLEIMPVNLNDILEEVIQQYPSVNVAHATFEIAGQLHGVSGSPSTLVQVLSNILTNAVKFVPHGGKAHVKVWTERSGEKVRLFVQDNGIGIPEEVLPKIFEPFQRGHADRGYDGTGIGLAIARKAVTRMGGSIGVKSTVGQGSTFWIELPAST